MKKGELNLPVVILITLGIIGSVLLLYFLFSGSFFEKNISNPENELSNDFTRECIPNCNNTQCGLDPICRKSCGQCEGTDTCTNGVCVSQNCVSQSNLVTCGTSVCGNKTNNCGIEVNCGTCQSGKTCQNGSCVQESSITTQNCRLGEDCLLLIVKNSLLPSLQTDLDIWKQDIKNEYNYNGIQKSISTETSQEIKNFIKTQSNLGNLKGILFVGNLPTVFTDLCMEGVGYCPSDHYYTDLDNSCFGISKIGNRCDGHTCNEITYYTSVDETKCSNFKASNPKFWIARLTTPNIQGNNITLLSGYFKRNHDYRTGKKSYEHKMLAYTPSLDSDFPSEVETFKQNFINQGSSIEKLNYYSGDINFISDPVGFGEVSNVYSEELKKSYEYVVYDGHGNPNSQQGMSSDELMTIKPNSLFYQLISCSVGDFTTDNYLAGNYLFDGDGLMVTAGTVPLFGTVQFPSIESFLLDNGFNFGHLFNNNFAVHLFGDPTLRLTNRTNSMIEIKNVNLGQIQIPTNINDFYYKYFNVSIKNLGNEKVRLLIKDFEWTFEPNDNSILGFIHLNSSLNFPISLNAGQEKIFSSEILVHGSLQPVKFSLNYTIYSNAKNYIYSSKLSGELI